MFSSISKLATAPVPPHPSVSRSGPDMAARLQNPSASTQMVSLIEVRGTNNSLVHPRGAVGVVTRTPIGDDGHYLVRFPDGFEASLTRDQLDVLKHFKDRLGNVLPTSCRQISQNCQQDAGSTFDLEQFSQLPELPSEATRAALNDLLVRVRSTSKGKL